MSIEIKEIIEYFKDDIDFLEEELKYPNFKGRYITIKDKECEYLRKLLDYITNLQEENERLQNAIKGKTFCYDEEEHKNLQEENKELNDDNIWWNNRFKAVERDNRNLKAKLEMYENGVYFSSENDELQQKIDKAIECINYYAIENSNYEKIYNIEEETLLDILGGKDGQ